MKNKPTIKDLTISLEHLINEKIAILHDLGNQSKELMVKINDLHTEMAFIVKELEPVEFLVRHQNPQLSELFDNLKEIIKDNNGI